MRLTKIKLIQIISMSVVVFCMIYANFYSVRRIMKLGQQVYLYDKLLVAYDLEGNKGLRLELDKILSQDNFQYELVLAKEFQVKFKELKSPGEYLRNNTVEYKKEISLIRGLRTAALTVLFVLFGWRLLVELMHRINRGKR